MNRGFVSAISALTIVGGTAAWMFWKKLTGNGVEVAERLVIKNALIKLRKRVYSTLREISLIANSIRALEGELEVRKISQIFMRDGGSGEKKLQVIQQLILKQANLTVPEFEKSCNYYYQHDIEIRILLDDFRKDLNLALEGVVQTYNGALPRLAPQKVLNILEQIIRRRMDIIKRKFIEGISNQQCILREFQMQISSQVVSQEYLQLQGIVHEKQPNQKLFLSILQNYYRSDYEFKHNFEQLELEMEMFIIQLQTDAKSKKEKEKKQQQQLFQSQNLMQGNKGALRGIIQDF